MHTYNKTIAALLVPAIIGLAGYVGITAEMPFSETVELVVGTLITAFFVWLVPNQK